jgi:hypothetical protein
VNKIKELKQAIKIERSVVDLLIVQCSALDGEMEQLRKENEKLRGALKIIWTWVEVEGQEVNRQDIQTLIKRELGT